MAKRRIGFFYLHCVNGEETLNIEENLLSVIRFIGGQLNRTKKKDISDDKFCFLDRYEYDEDRNLLKMLFKSARHSYRAPLINRNTVESRENPKTREEGEQVKTHLLVKFINGEAIVFLETGKSILTLKIICEYLNTFVSVYNNNHRREHINGTFDFDIIPRDDFREVLDNMRRVVFAEVYIDKQILGSDSLNFSNRLDYVQEDIVIGLKTKKNESIKHTIYDMLDKMTGGRNEIRRVRVKGKMSDSTESIIDTNFIIKKEFIDAQQDDDTGEYNTPYMFSQLELLSNDF